VVFGVIAVLAAGGLAEVARRRRSVTTRPGVIDAPDDDA
jgi:hypothetical protein